MNIYKIEINNYRLLKKFTLDLEESLSLVIGKNNTGKTSILSALNKFLNPSTKAKILIDDFNLDFKKRLKSLIESDDIIPEVEYEELGISLNIYIRYAEEDDLSNVRRLMTDLDPVNNVIVLGYGYIINYFNYIDLRKKYLEFKDQEAQKKEAKAEYIERDINEFLRLHYDNYFEHYRRSYIYDVANQVIDKENFIDLDREEISSKDVLNFKYISAKRDVTNKENNNTLSRQTSEIYNKTEIDDDRQQAVEEFKDTLSQTDTNLSSVYSKLFDDVVKKVREYGGIRLNESQIEIVSTLQHRELLQGNTTVLYKHDPDNTLPEYFNGLGYMNLISMIFEIEIKIHDFKREKEIAPADINLLFIEEPEAHTHPQMQYVFIKNIKKLLGEKVTHKNGAERKLQCLISTHSSHITADSDFNDIKYLKKIETNAVDAKNLKDLESHYEGGDENQKFKFLKQYLTLNRAELLFADKAIFIEGDTERILLPAMMRKLDNENPNNPLLSQNISIVEVGAHSHIFEKFIDFLGIKSLVITDIDSGKLEPKLDNQGKPKVNKKGEPTMITKQCSVAEGTHTTNNALCFYFGKNTDELEYFSSLPLENKTVKINAEGNWQSDTSGNVLIVFQIEEEGHHARSFEDAFFHINKDFICHEANEFPSLRPTYLKRFRDNEDDAFELSDGGVIKKPPLAMEILLNSKADEQGHEFSNWKIPLYIKEGLLWLKKD